MQSIKLALLATGVTLGALATSAQAATCLTSDVSGASACSGYVSGNIFSNGQNNPATVTSMLADLGFDASGIDFGSLYSNSGLKLSNLNGATSLSFSGAPELFGETFIGIHWGGQGGGQSAIYKIDFSDLASVIDIIGKNPGGTSNAVLFSTTPYTPGPGGVPEPATWALMIMGFGAIGATMRHRQAKVRFA